MCLVKTLNPNLSESGENSSDTFIRSGLYVALKCVFGNRTGIVNIPDLEWGGGSSAAHQPKQPPCPATVAYFHVTSISRRIRTVCAYCKIGVQMRPRPSQLCACRQSSVCVSIILPQTVVTVFVRTVFRSEELIDFLRVLNGVRNWMF